MLTSVEEALRTLRELSGLEWEVQVIHGEANPTGSYGVVFRSEEYVPRFEDIVLHRGFQCPLHVRGGYYAAGREGIYFDASVSGALHRFENQIGNRHIFMCTVPIPNEVVIITDENRLEVMRSIVRHDRLAYGVSRQAPHRSEFVKAAEPGSRFRPQNLLLLCPIEAEASKESDDARQDVDSTIPR